MDNETEALVNQVEGALADAPVLHELEPDETVELRIGYFKSPRRDVEGATVSFHFGRPDLAEEIADTVEPRLDKRKFKLDSSKPKYRRGRSWTIGTVTVNGDGEVVNYDIQEEYLKPTEQ